MKFVMSVHREDMMCVDSNMHTHRPFYSQLTTHGEIHCYYTMKHFTLSHPSHTHIYAERTAVFTIDN